MKDVAQFRSTFKWSATRLLQMLVCSMQFWYDRLSGIDVPKPWYYVFGGAVHNFIEFAHKGPRRARFKPTPHRPLFYKSPVSLGRAWFNFWARYVQKLGGKEEVIWNPPWNTYSTLAGLGRQLLAGGGGHSGYYPRLMKPLFAFNICAVEYFFDTYLYLDGYGSSSKMPIVGRFDQLWRVKKSGALESVWAFEDYDEAIAVTDLTTSRYAPSDAKYLQIALYLEALSVLIKEDSEVRKQLGSGCDQLPLMGFVWNLRRGTIVPRWSWDRARLVRQAVRADNRLSTSDFVETDNDYVCRVCQWREHCRNVQIDPLDFAGDVLDKVRIGELREQSPKPPKQLFFKKGVKAGGWMRGEQIRGEDIE